MSRWIKAALKESEEFPIKAQDICLRALTVAAKGEKAGIAKPFKGAGAGSLKSHCLCAGMHIACCKPRRFLTNPGDSRVPEEIDAGY